MAGTGMSNQWFRFYAEALEDPKVQSLPPKYFKIWVNILCLACKSGGKLPTVTDISFCIRQSKTETKLVLLFLKGKGLLDLVEGTTDCYTPHSWDKRQYKSDGSTERVKRFRNATETKNVTETKQDQITDTDTDTDTEKKEIEGAPAPPKRKPEKKRPTRLTPEWTLPQEWGEWAETQGLSGDEIIRQGQKFRNHWISKAGASAAKLDWYATWQNWIFQHLEGFKK